MSTKADNALESLMNGLVQYVDNKINAIPYVKTDIGVVKAVNLVNGKYIHTITVRNFDYTGIKSLGNNEFTSDSPVYILVPNGQYNNMFILGYMDDVNASIKGGSINIGNGKFVVDKNGNMTAIGGGKIGLFSLEDGGFKYYSSESPTDVLGYIEPSEAGGFGGIAIGGQSLDLESTRAINISSNSVSITANDTNGIVRINENGTCLVPIENEDVKVGDKIVVNLNVESSQDMEFVFLKDMRAACLEPVEQISRYKYQDGMLYYQSNSDTFMGFYFDKLPKGKHQLSYSMFVTKEGDFSNGYALIQCMYSPEFSAYSEGMRIKVGM